MKDANEANLSSLIQNHVKLSNALAVENLRLHHSKYILLMIEAELRYSRVIHHLESAGITVDLYYSNLSRVILPMMGFEQEQLQTDDVWSYYYDLFDDCMRLPWKEFVQGIPQLAHSIYHNLLEIKQQGKG